jgi:hypothetical protein
LNAPVFGATRNSGILDDYGYAGHTVKLVLNRLLQSKKCAIPKKMVYYSNTQEPMSMKILATRIG